MSAAIPTTRRGSWLTPMNFMIPSVQVKWRLRTSWPGNSRCAIAIGLGEIASLENRNVQRREKARRDRAQLAVWIVLVGASPPALDGKRQALAETPEVAPRHAAADGDQRDAGDVGDPAPHFAI